MRVSAADAKKVSENVPRGKTQGHRSDYMAAPANALADGRIGANKLILAAGSLDEIIIKDPDTGPVIRTYPSLAVQALHLLVAALVVG